MKILLLSLMSILYFSPLGYAQTKSQLQMIQDFKEAVSSKDKEKIHQTWIKIWEQKDLVDYMKKNMPDEFLLYKSYRLVMKVNNLRKEYSGVSLGYDEDISSSYVPSVISSIGGGGEIKNRRLIQKNINQNRLSNRKRAQRARNQDKISNRRLMRNSINNSRKTRSFSNNKQYRRQRPNKVR